MESWWHRDVEHVAGEFGTDLSSGLSFDEVAAHLTSATAEKGGGKFVAVHVKDDPACDAKFKEIKASVRCIPLKDEFDGAGTCIITGERVAQRVIVAKAY